MTHNTVPGSLSSRVLEGEVKRLQAKGLRLFRSLRGRKLFAIALPLLLLIGGKWLGTYPASILSKGITAQIALLKIPGPSSLMNALKLPQLDIVQVHEYSEQLSVGDRDPAVRVGQELLALKKILPAKPILLGEFGYSARNYGEDVEKTGIQLHNGLWATTFSGYAGSGMYWWWDIYIAENNLWSQYKGLTNFMNGVDLTQYQLFSSLEITDQEGASGGQLASDCTARIRSDGCAVKIIRLMQPSRREATSKTHQFMCLH